MNDIRIVDESGETVKPPAPHDGISEYAVDAPLELARQEVGAFLGLEKPSELDHYDDELKLLLDYAKANSQTGTLEDLKWALRQLELKLGSPSIGEDRIAYLARYAYILKEGDRLAEEKAKFERKTL